MFYGYIRALENIAAQHRAQDACRDLIRTLDDLFDSLEATVLSDNLSVQQFNNLTLLQLRFIQSLQLCGPVSQLRSKAIIGSFAMIQGKLWQHYQSVVSRAVE